MRRRLAAAWRRDPGEVIIGSLAVIAVVGFLSFLGAIVTGAIKVEDTPGSCTRTVPIIMSIPHPVRVP